MENGMEKDELIPVIGHFLKKVDDTERQLRELKNAVNILCHDAGLPPRFVDIGNSRDAKAITRIKPDSFYGKQLSTAIREFLTMRKSQDMGPAKPREIFEALRLGGYEFETKDDEIALNSLRATLRKNSAVFHRLPNGSYGLLAWYPDAKKPKNGDEKSDKDQEGSEAGFNHIQVAMTAALPASDGSATAG
jgi:hypothetical protein